MTLLVFLATIPVLKPGLPLLFADDSTIESKSAVSRVYHVAKCDREPVVRADRPWEGRCAGVYGSVNRQGDGWRMWYNNSGDRTFVADSTDGKVWTKPAINVYGSMYKDNNIVCDRFGSPSVLLDPFEKNPSRRYKMVGVRYVKSGSKIDEKETGYYTSTSPDGIHWNESVKVLDSCDTVTMAQNPQTGRFFIYHKICASVADASNPAQRRLVYVSCSDDFRTWSKPELALAPDDADDAAWIDGPHQRTDIYNMAVIAHAGGFIGFPTMFRVLGHRPYPEKNPKKEVDDGPIDVQLATSADGMSWRRTPGRRVVIPLGAAGDFDGGMIPGVSSGSPVTIGDETALYYYGVSHSHGVGRDDTVFAVGRAVWRRWGFVSLEAMKDGKFVTRPVVLKTSDVRVNVEMLKVRKNPFVRIVALSEDDRTLAVSEPITESGTQVAIRWKDGKSPSFGVPVKFKISLNSAAVYALEVF